MRQILLNSSGAVVARVPRPIVERGTVLEWLNALSAAGVPCARVNDVGEALDEPQALAREAVVEHEHPVLGSVRTVRTPLRVGESQRSPERGPFRGEHTEEILVGWCGYSPQRVRELAAAGVFGDVAPRT